MDTRAAHAWAEASPGEAPDIQDSDFAFRQLVPPLLIQGSREWRGHTASAAAQGLRVEESAVASPRAALAAGGHAPFLVDIL